jgi:hypothetical protein
VLDAGDHGLTIRTNEDGHTVLELAAPAAVDSSAPTVFGINTDPADYSPVYGGQFGHARVARVFTPPGKGIVSWSDPKVAGLPPHIMPHVSFKDWPGDTQAAAWLRTWLDKIPAYLLDGPVLPELGLAAAITYQHEVENNGVPVLDYQHRSEVLYDVVKTHRNGSRVAVIPIQTLQWTQMKTTTKSVKGDGNIMPWWAGIGDYCGVDCYAFEATPYPDPKKFVELPLRLARATGRRLWVPEFATVKAEDDPSGSKRATWIRAVVAELVKAQCASVSWWHALGSKGTDYRLDPAGAGAWNAVSGVA